MELLEYMKNGGYEQVVTCFEPSTNLRAFIVIHDTTLGPACGGVRVWPHKTEEIGLMDVLRLAKAMTYKSAVAGLPLGGGKALILADPNEEKDEQLLRAFGQYVDTLGGRYLATEDVGMTPLDLEYIAKETDYVVGLPESLGGSGDTSPLTGLGVYLGMKACAKSVWNSDNLEGRTVAMQGFGKVGKFTAEHLIAEGVNLVVTDINENVLAEARNMGAKTTTLEEIYDVKCDIFSPCALGGVLNSDTIPRLNCAIVAGGANNQLLASKNGEELSKAGILYAPDYVINAGGIINASCELDGVYRKEQAEHMAQGIYDTTSNVINISKKDQIPTHVAADKLAESRLNKMRAMKKLYR